MSEQPRDAELDMECERLAGDVEFLRQECNKAADTIATQAAEIDRLTMLSVEHINSNYELRTQLTRLTAERDAATTEIATLRDRLAKEDRTGGIHTCHDHCPRPMCVMRRERDAAREDAKRMREENAMLMKRVGYEGIGSNVYGEVVLLCRMCGQQNRTTRKRFEDGEFDFPPRAALAPQENASGK